MYFNAFGTVIQEQTLCRLGGQIIGLRHSHRGTATEQSEMGLALGRQLLDAAATEAAAAVDDDAAAAVLWS